MHLVMLEGLETEDIYSFTRFGFFFMKRKRNFCVAAACAGQL